MRNKFDNRPERDITYLYRDEDIVVVSKPAWLLSVPGRGEDKIDSVAHRVQQRHSQARVVHRLDWATSGVMIMALNADAHRNLNKQFADRKTQKRYIAIVAGIVEKDEQIIDMPLRCDWENRPRQIVDWQQGKASQTITYVDRRDREKQQTRLILKPITGRSHQLRVHCQQIGHPIIGDQLYAPPRHRDISPRLLLHAEWLQVYHPSTVKPIEFFDNSPF
ncbi:MAG: RNA pseudouridine synthase [Gammaproteobacteria bacterium]|nr:MAG: RNA pseudouridine synthase [Gammaproteobacteria bacterium]